MIEKKSIDVVWSTRYISIK